MKIVLAYSGGLDTSVLLKWIKETYQAEMIAFCADVGQMEELKGLDKKAKQTGASKIYIEDLRAEFAKDFVCVCVCVVEDGGVPGGVAGGGWRAVRALCCAQKVICK